jgi:hypothetical protein
MSKGSSSEKVNSSEKKRNHDKKDIEDINQEPEEEAIQKENPRSEKSSEESSKGKELANKIDEAPREKEIRGDNVKVPNSDKTNPKKRKRRKKADAKKQDTKAISEVEGESKDKGKKQKEKNSAGKRPKTRSKKQPLPSSPEEIVGMLKRLKEDIGQIKEMSFEEGNLVGAFALAFLELMEPLAKSLPLDVSILPQELGFIERANVIPKGELVLLHMDGRMESIDLTEPEKRDLLVNVVSDVMPKFNALIADRRLRIENRITFLSSITKELQNLAESFATVNK